MSDVAEILRAVAWPVTVLVLARAFRRELRSLLSRLREGGGAKFDPPPQMGAATTAELTSAASGASATLEKNKTSTMRLWESRLFDNQLLKDAKDSAERETLLKSIGALGFTLWQFEAIDAQIWGSQVAMLEYLNSRATGELASTLQGLFYEPAKTHFADAYRNYAFDAYLRFLENFSLIAVAPTAVTLTDIGRDYLAWRLNFRRAPRVFG